MSKRKKGGGIKIVPTGTCFEDCTLKFMEMLRAPHHLANPSFYLVHGICLMENGEPYSHAWLELDGRAIQSGLNAETGEKLALVQPIGEFHRQMRVQEFTRYNFRDCNAMALKYGDVPPPWEEKYRRLTIEGKRKK